MNVIANDDMTDLEDPTHHYDWDTRGWHPGYISELIQGRACRLLSNVSGILATRRKTGHSQSARSNTLKPWGSISHAFSGCFLNVPPLFINVGAYWQD